MEQIEKEIQQNGMLSWETRDYEFKEKSADWYWTIGLAGVLGAGIAIWLDNYLFTVICIIGTVLLIYFGSHHPDPILYDLDASGLLIEKKIHIPFSQIQKFWITNKTPGKLLLHTTKSYMPFYTIPLSGVSSISVREILASHKVLEEYIEESITVEVMEKAGF